MEIGRRHFMQRAAALSLGFGGLARVVEGRTFHARRIDGLVPDPDGVLDLPEGFTYRIFSKCGDEMSDGLLVPGKHDGMAAFPGEDGLTILVRNHEIEPAHDTISFFGPQFERRSRVDPSLIYDNGVTF
ncbi:MAG: DUF839 domain-containing protein, partial [Phycisphaerales bacterium]|nr:DUF839 domain-containing protein [Phycisphaerales bacterium]